MVWKSQTWLILLLAVAGLLTMGGCANSASDTPSDAVQSENLYTLGKVWGVAKYYPPPSRQGQRIGMRSCLRCCRG